MFHNFRSWNLVSRKRRKLREQLFRTKHCFCQRRLCWCRIVCRSVRYTNTANARRKEMTKAAGLNQVFRIISVSPCLCIFGSLFHYRLLYTKILFVRSIRWLHNDFWLQFVCCSAIKLLMLMTKNAFARNASCNRPKAGPAMFSIEIYFC